MQSVVIYQRWMRVINELNRHLSDSNEDEALAILLIHYCKDQPRLNSLFGQIDDYTELLLPTNLLSKDGIIDLINDKSHISDEDYKEVELIGWLYQFYIADKKDDVFASFKKKQKPEQRIFLQLLRFLRLSG